MPLTPEEGIRIKANNIHAAAGEIIGVLEDTSIGNVIYFEGWDGLGASAVFKVLAQRLKLSKLKFDKIIHVDCSAWKSKRALQKAIAKEVGLPTSVIATIDRCDEDDDFNGVDEGSRELISDVTRKIYQKLAKSTLVVIFHNGSNGYVELTEFGIPVYPLLSNKVLWTFQGRFLCRKRVADNKEAERIMGNTDAYLYATLTDRRDEADGSKLWDLVHEEAEGVAQCTGMAQHINHRTVEDCIMYMWALQDIEGIDWGIHASNYWVCDGIIQGDCTGRSAWEMGDALHSCMHMDWSWDYMGHAVPYSAPHLQRDVPRQAPIYCSSSSPSKITSLPPEASSFFVAGSDEADTVLLPAVMFQHSDSSKLHVLHLSFCTFSFSSPPFLCCRNLRFLFLNHCKDGPETAQDQDCQSQDQRRPRFLFLNHCNQRESWMACFRKLWVLDLSHTDWYWLLSEEMMNLMVNLRELNVKGVKHWSIHDLRCNSNILAKLRVIVDPVPTKDDGTNNAKTILSSSNSHNTIILDNCIRLEQVVLINIASIETGGKSEGGGASKISSISFRGCSHLKILILRGIFGSLEKLDLSGTSVKTLDLREVKSSHLKQLILLGCKQLCAILWPEEWKNRRRQTFEVLRIDNIQSALSCEAYWEEKTKARKLGSSGAAYFCSNWFISIRDARLLRSLLPTEDIEKRHRYVHMEMDSPPTSTAQKTRNLQQPNHHLYARDVIYQDLLLHISYNEDVLTCMWGCPLVPTANEDSDCYLRIQDEEDMKRRILQQQGSTEGTGSSSATTLLPGFISGRTKMLHVHDSLYITGIQFSPHSDWYFLKWCRVERCPKLQSVFSTNTSQRSGGKAMFWYLRTLWASQLLSARYIWNWSIISQAGRRSFEDLEFLHLDYCPRLIHVLPLSMDMVPLRTLKTLEIVWCGDLTEVFPLDSKCQEQEKVIDFPRLRHIHLQELPMLKDICGLRMSAPSLETIKIRGCWSLKRLPAVSKDAEPPNVDCEKEWWDNLEWDGLEMNHHPSLYQSSHSLYYKKAQLPRGTILR